MNKFSNTTKHVLAKSPRLQGGDFGQRLEGTQCGLRGNSIENSTGKMG